MKTRKPIKRSSRPIARRNAARRKKEFARAYHSKQRVEFVKTLACAACGVVGYSENAHVAPPSEKGTGYKADYRFIAPLCRNRMDFLGVRRLRITAGCHQMYDRERWRFDSAFPDFDATKACEATEAAWLLEESA